MRMKKKNLSQFNLSYCLMLLGHITLRGGTTMHHTHTTFDVVWHSDDDWHSFSFSFSFGVCHIRERFVLLPHFSRSILHFSFFFSLPLTHIRHASKHTHIYQYHKTSPIILPLTVECFLSLTLNRLLHHIYIKPNCSFSFHCSDIITSQTASTHTYNHTHQ